MDWQRWTRASVMAQLVSGVLSSGAIIWAAVNGILLPATPAWVVIASGVVILLSGIAIGQRLPRRGAIKSLNLIHAFDYRDFYPPVESRGWTLDGSASTTNKTVLRNGVSVFSRQANNNDGRSIVSTWPVRSVRALGEVVIGHSQK